MDIIVLEPENPQEVCMNGPVAEAEVEERVNSESCDRSVKISLFYTSTLLQLPRL